MEMKITTKDLLIGLAIGGLTAALIASFFEPFSDDQLQQMQFEQTQGLPQDR